MVLRLAHVTGVYPFQPYLLCAYHIGASGLAAPRALRGLRDGVSTGASAGP